MPVQHTYLDISITSVNTDSQWISDTTTLILISNKPTVIYDGLIQEYKNTNMVYLTKKAYILCQKQILMMNSTQYDSWASIHVHTMLYLFILQHLLKHSQTP